MLYYYFYSINHYVFSDTYVVAARSPNVEIIVFIFTINYQQPFFS